MTAKRAEGDSSPFSTMEEIIIKQSEIIESLTWLNKKLIELLSQHTEVEEYEFKLRSILAGNEEII